MSALPPKADIRPRDQDICFGPEADIPADCRLMTIKIVSSAVAQHSKIGRSCPSWVNNRHPAMSAPRLLYPDKRTFAGTGYMSALGQKQTHAPQQKSPVIRSPRRHAVARKSVTQLRLLWQFSD